MLTIQELIVSTKWKLLVRYKEAHVSSNHLLFANKTSQTNDVRVQLHTLENSFSWAIWAILYHKPGSLEASKIIQTHL